MHLRLTLCRLKQSLMPPALRIAAPDESDLFAGFLALPAAEAAELDDGTVVKLCNEVHRLRINRARLRGDPNGEDAAKNLNIASVQMKEAIDHIEEALKALGVELRDLTGEPIVGTRLDFEDAGQAPVVDESLTCPTIQMCVLPKVLRKGKMLQRARGFVAVPPA